MFIYLVFVMCLRLFITVHSQLYHLDSLLLSIFTFLPGVYFGLSLTMMVSFQAIIHTESVYKLFFYLLTDKTKKAVSKQGMIFCMTF